MTKTKLTPAQKKRRFMRQPIMPGASITRRQLKRQVRAEARTKYDPVLSHQRRDVAEAQTYKRDIGNYYTDYLRQVQRQSENVQNIGREAQQAVQNLQGGVTGLAQADLSQVNRQATADAAGRGATAGDLSQMASNAAATRQALVGSFAAQQAASNAAASRYATNRANVVAPGQRIGAIAMAHGRVRQAREKVGETKAQKAAFKVQRRQEIRGEEAKNVLASQIAGVEAGQKQREFRETVREHKAGERIDRQRINADLQKAADSAARSGNKRATSGAFAGLTQAQIDALTPAQAKQLIRRYDNKSDGGGGGPELMTKGQQGEGLRQLPSLKNLMTKAKRGELFEPGTGNPPPLGRYAGERKVAEYIGTKVKHPALARAAADAIYDGHISAFTEKRLRAAGYRPREVAATLGVPTHRQFVRRYGTRPGVTIGPGFKR